MVSRSARLGLVLTLLVVAACSPPVDPPIASPTSAPSSEPTTEPTNAASPIDAPAVLQVACDGVATGLSASRVRVQPDGVHIHLTATSGDTIDVTIDDAAGMSSLGESIAGREVTLVETFGPGDYSIGCGGSSASFAVVDPLGTYVPPNLPCDDSTGSSGTTGGIDYAEGATGPLGSALDVARLELRGLEPGDVVERAGYPRAAGDAIVHVVREGQAVALLRYAPDGHGGWLIVETHTCAGSAITVQPPD